MTCAVFAATPCTPFPSPNANCRDRIERGIGAALALRPYALSVCRVSEFHAERGDVSKVERVRHRAPVDSDSEDPVPLEQTEHNGDADTHQPRPKARRVYESSVLALKCSLTGPKHWRH